MPTNTTYTGAPVPIASENPDIPAGLMAYASAIDDQHVLYATSQANRDTQYANVREGAIVSCPSLGIVWQKKTTPPTAADWRILSEVGPVATSGVITAATGFSTSYQYAQRLNGWTHIQAAFSYTGATVTADGATGALPGNITDTKVCDIGTTYRWNTSTLGTNSAYVFAMINAIPATLRIQSDGQAFLAATVTSGFLAAGHLVTFHLRWPSN